MAPGNRRSSPPAKTADLTHALIDSSIDTRETADIQSRVLIALDFPTRIFAVDGLSSEEALVFTGRRTVFAGWIGLSLSAPRAALNAVLESGLQKHIDAPDVVYFVTVMVLQLAPTALNTGKLLQRVLERSKDPLFSRRDTRHKISHRIWHAIIIINYNNSGWSIRVISPHQRYHRHYFAKDYMGCGSASIPELRQ
ncbi:unnamed protein product [Tuber aestivum]|uniref:Uncharacterized protein n=1 Tax=Tuber aestivum TaxID=59557 RepID=A0A292Q287_9PEZI|nr:unnamed protein product [Tuber aestivum]